MQSEAQLIVAGSDSIPLTDFYVIPASGLYELTVAQVVLSPYPPVNSGTLTTVFYYTDETGVHKITPASPVSLDQPRSNSGFATFSAVAGTSINYTAIVSNKVGATISFIVKAGLKRVA